MKTIDSIGIYSLYGKPVDIKLSLSSNCLDFYPMSSESNIAYSKNWHVLSFQKKDARCIELLIDKSELNITTISELEIYKAKAVVVDEYTTSLIASDYTILILIIVAAIIITVIVILRDRIIEGFRNLGLWLKYR